MNCPTKDTNQSSVPGYNQNPSTLDNDLVTNSTFNSSPRSKTLSKINWTEDIGQFQEMSENDSPKRGYQDIPGSQDGSSSITKLTTLRSTNPNSNPKAEAEASPQFSSLNILNKHSSNGERTPLCSPPNNKNTFGGFPLDSNSQHQLDNPNRTSTTNASEIPRLSQESNTNESNDYENLYFNNTQNTSNNSILSRFRSLFSNNGFSPLNDSNNPSRNGGNNYGRNAPKSNDFRSKIQRIYKIIVKYLKFVGPGMLLSSSFCDPGNYITGTAAGALYRYKLLFAILLSNFFAVFLQILCTKLGCVTGLDLAQNCRQHLPRWLNITVYIMAEIAIIATDLAEVVGTAIALNILFHIPLAFGVVFTIIDVLVVLMAYRPNGEMKIVRYFEYLVSALVLIVVACFAIELGSIAPSDTSEIFRGFLPSKEIFENDGLYLFCGILGATVMPHSLYLGSGIVQPRLRDYDEKHGYFFGPSGDDEIDEIANLKYRPSIHAINYSLKYSIIELVISLFTVALFVNSAILIVAGSTLSNTPDAADADLYSIYDMLRTLLSPLAGTVFALALLFSGQSSGVVCTLAGQMVSEGFLHWSFKPWVRRLITRSLSVLPCFIATLFIGRKGLALVLTASQVVLSLLLPFVSAPLLYFTAKKSIMSVSTNPPRVNPNARFNSENENGGLSRFSEDTELADNVDVLASAIATHSTNHYTLNRLHESGAGDFSRGRLSLEDGTALSPTQTLTDPNDNAANFERGRTSHEDNSENEDLIISGGDDSEHAPLTRNAAAFARLERRNLGSSDRLSLDSNTNGDNHEDDDYEDADDYSLATSSIVVPEFKDMSNSMITNVIACLIFLVTSAINMFLIVSAALGADVRF